MEASTRLNAYGYAVGLAFRSSAGGNLLLQQEAANRMTGATSDSAEGRLPETGNVDNATWEAIYNQYSGIENTALRSGENFPAQSRTTAVPAFARQGRTPEQTTLTQLPGKDLALGSRDPVVREVVR